jgi:CheY-like chemotaxis protein
MLHKVLVVNDNELLLLIAKKMIALSNFAEETITATNGLEAIEYFENLLQNEKDASKNAPEFIFLDLHMPSLDGWGFLELFTEKYATHFPKLKIAILSASVDMQEMLMLVKYPIVIDFVSTPINEEVLNVVKVKYYASQFQKA